MSAATLTDTTKTSRLSLGKSGTVPQTLPQESALSAERPALVIGDIHGHLDRLENLLLQEDLIQVCPICKGKGNLLFAPERDHTHPDWVDKDKLPRDLQCARCSGLGCIRTTKEADVILIGDLGHFGKGGSPTGDKMVWEAADAWADVILWGNHDRACFDPRHAHSGLIHPSAEVCELMLRLARDGRLLLADASHGFLLTHAGVHTAFRDQKVDDVLKTDPQAFAEWVNVYSDPFGDIPNRDVQGIVDSISFVRGGRQRFGGILWRDIGEKLYPGFRQIFGHSADHKSHKVRYCWEYGHTRKPASFPDSITRPSYCIDIGGKNDEGADNCLAGIWLPSEKIVRVDL